MVFSQDEWALLNSAQKILYKDVMMEKIGNLASMYHLCNHSLITDVGQKKTEARGERNYPRGLFSFRLGYLT